MMPCETAKTAALATKEDIRREIREDGALFERT